MQSKGAVKLFAITMALVCLYQLSFTWVTGHWEDNAEMRLCLDADRAVNPLQSSTRSLVFGVVAKS